MSRLYNRTFKLTIYRQPTGFVSANPSFFETLDNGVEITKLRVQFKINKSITKEPNHQDITIYNLNANSRGLFDQKPLFCRLEAGYDGFSRTIFLGDLIFADSQKDGTEWVTRAQFGDGLRAFSYARVNRLYKSGVQVIQVLQDICLGMGMTVPQKVMVDPQLQQQLSTSQSLFGPSRDALTNLLAPYGYHWSIQNNQLQILTDEGTRDDQAIVVTAGLNGTGVIGSPERMAPDKKSGSSPGVKFKMLLYPELTPGRRVVITSDRINGIYCCKKVDHTGDNFGTSEDDWTTEVEAQPSP